MAAALVLCAAGSGVALLAASRDWVSLDVSREPPLPVLSVSLDGRDLEPAVTALAVVGLAGIVGLLATRKLGRVVLAAVLALAGAVIVARALPHLGGPSHGRALELAGSEGVGVSSGAQITASVHPLWPLLAALGGLLLTAGALLTAVRARRWPSMSGRYEPKSKVAQPGETSSQALWDAQDRGDDLTASSSADSGALGAGENPTRRPS